MTPKRLALTVICSFSTVHDEIGRGNFLAIYLASGAIGSMFSLSRSVVLGYLGMSSCGASAATSGIVAAWCMYHFKYVVYLPYLFIDQDSITDPSDPK